MCRVTAISTAALGFIAIASAEPLPYNIDASHSRIWFDVSHQGYSAMRGLFRDFGGSFNFDAENPVASTLDITIDASSINMFHDGLNVHLKNDDFFGVENYPELHFVSTGIEVTGEDQFVVHGDLTILGQTNPVSLDATQNLLGTAGGGAEKVGFSATTSVNRTDYGMTFGVPNIGADIAISIQLEATHSVGTGGMGMRQ
jgi:polyisoprenoid-binding protein YceI